MPGAFLGTYGMKKKMNTTDKACSFYKGMIFFHGLKKICIINKYFIIIITNLYKLIGDREGK